MAKIKYPRVMVTHDRHAELSKEARKRNITIAQLAEQRLKKTK